MVLTKPEQLFHREHRTLTSQLILSHIFLTVQVFLLTLFAPTLGFPGIFLFVLDLLYRVYQYWKICHYWRWRAQQETIKITLAYIILVAGIAKIVCRESFPPQGNNYRRSEDRVNVNSVEEESEQSSGNHAANHEDPSHSDVRTNTRPFQNPHGSQEKRAWLDNNKT